MSVSSRVQQPRWWQSGGLTAAVSIVTNLSVLVIGSRVVTYNPRFTALQPGPIIVFTLFGVAGATGVGAFIWSRFQQPRRVFTGVAVSVLLLSLLPDVALHSATPSSDASHSLPAASWGEVLVLMAMHLVTGVLCILLIPRLSQRDTQ